MSTECSIDKNILVLYRDHLQSLIEVATSSTFDPSIKHVNEVPFNAALGICFNLNLVGELSNASSYTSAYIVVAALSVGWPEHSGGSSSSMVDTRTLDFHATKGRGKWLGEQLVLRINLMEHLHSQLNIIIQWMGDDESRAINVIKAMFSMSEYLCCLERELLHIDPLAFAAHVRDPANAFTTKYLSDHSYILNLLWRDAPCAL